MNHSILLLLGGVGIAAAVYIRFREVTRGLR